MNCGPSGLKPDKAILGFLQHKMAEGLSPNTLKSCEQLLSMWAPRMGDELIEEISSDDVREYLAWLRIEYKPRRASGNDQPLSPKSLHNVWIGLCSFCTWASSEFKFESPMKGGPAPKYEDPPIEPFTKEQIEALLKASEYTREANTDRRRKFAKRRPTAKRDRALILFLLDTGLRASELCSLTIGDLDQKTGRVSAKLGVAGGAKGGKGCTAFLGKTARAAFWRYLASREDGEDLNAYLFSVQLGRRLDKGELRHLLLRLGKKVDIAKCYPHRFRHTFAITYLRSGGDLFSL